MDGNWQDSSGKGNHGTANGSATFSSNAKVGGQSGSLEGVGDYIVVTDDDSLDPSEISISGWIYINDFADTRVILAKGGSTQSYRIDVDKTTHIMKFYDRGNTNRLDSTDTISLKT